MFDSVDLKATMEVEPLVLTFRFRVRKYATAVRLHLFGKIQENGYTENIRRDMYLCLLPR